MNTRRIGTTELEVSEIGYGAMHLSIDLEKRPPEKESIALIKAAVEDLGITFIDTADAYCADSTEVGHNERLIAQALKDSPNRDRVIVATKGGSTRPEGRWHRDGSPKHLREACEQSLRSLGVERIDLYQHHAPDPRVPVEESVGTLADLQREGKIRYIGLSNYNVELLERARREAEIVSLQNQFSVINQRAEEEVLRYCEQNNITYIPWNPVGGRGKAPNLGEESSVLEEIAREHKTGPHVVAIAWLLQKSPMMLPIPGTRKLDHLREDLSATDLRLSDEEMQRLNGERE